MASQSGVFVIQQDKTLVAMQPTEFSAEVDFQALLTKFPALLVGDQIDPEHPRRFLLVRQEQSIGHQDAVNRWSVDHLFLDQTGIPTLVEVKRQSDTRLRREVVGQMLDYASNCQSFWTWESIRSTFEETCAASGSAADVVLSGFLDENDTTDAFWDRVKTNLQAGRLRMLFVADHIPTELRRIVEFLNEQMDPAEILAIELRQFAADGLRTLVPMVFGQTQEAAKKKVPPPGVRWTEERFMETIVAKSTAAEANVVRSILDWMKGCGLPLVYGVGRESGSISPLLKPQGITINPAYLSTEGKIWFQFKYLMGKPVFGDVSVRRELMERFARVNQSGIGEKDLDGFCALAFSKIAADPQGKEKIISAYQWMIEQVTGHA